MSAHTIACPVDECEGEIELFEEESEQGPYADCHYDTWTYLLMSDPGTCSAGHTFTPKEQEKIENDATQDYVNGLMYDES